jgi:hypothetical protein
VPHQPTITSREEPVPARFWLTPTAALDEQHGRRLLVNERLHRRADAAELNRAVDADTWMGMVFSKLNCKPLWRERLPELVRGRRGNARALVMNRLRYAPAAQRVAGGSTTATDAVPPSDAAPLSEAVSITER